MEWSDFFLIFSNLSMLLAIKFSVKNRLFLEAWIFFQSMAVSMTYHGLDTTYYIKHHNHLWRAFKFIDFYCAILVMITLSVYTAKVPDKYKGIPHIILGTFSVFWLSYGTWDISRELIIAAVCFSMVFGIFLFRRKCPRFRKKNLIKGGIFAISGIGCFHIKYYNDDLPYWLSHTLWHIFIMLAAFYIMRIHPVEEIRKMGRDAMHRVVSMENFMNSSPVRRRRLEEVDVEVEVV